MVAGDPDYCVKLREIFVILSYGVINATTEKMRIKSRVLLGVLLSFSVVPFETSAGEAEVPIQRVQVGFGSMVTDDDVSLLLHNRSIEVSAAFVSVAGLNGTFRRHEGTTTQDLLEEARQASIGYFEDSIDANNQFMSKFLEDHNIEEVANSPGLVRQMQSLISLANQFETALNDLRSNEPMVYGLEIAASPQDLGRLKEDNDRLAFANLRAPVAERMQIVKPRGLLVQRDDFIPENLSATELYEAMESGKVLRMDRLGIE